MSCIQKLNVVGVSQLLLTAGDRTFTSNAVAMNDEEYHLESNHKATNNKLKTSIGAHNSDKHRRRSKRPIIREATSSGPAYITHSTHPTATERRTTNVSTLTEGQCQKCATSIDKLSLLKNQSA